MPLIRDCLVVVRGAGDLATGCIVRLVRAGFRVVALETLQPSSIRRAVCLSEAVYDGESCVEGVRAIRFDGPPATWDPLEVPLLVDPEGSSIRLLAPLALVDAIVAKRSTGTHPGLAPVVVALGPGFVAGRDAHAVVETNRGHDLGRVLLEGCAEADTGVPGKIGGEGLGRVVRSPAAGKVEACHAIGDTVTAGETLLTVQGIPVQAEIGGVLRGLIRPGFAAHAGLKVADVDPRGVRASCFTISDKARAIAGGVLEAILALAPG